MATRGPTVGWNRDLRDEAETRLRLMPAPASGPDTPVLPLEDQQKMLYEVRVHQIELEIQNEELRLAQNLLSRAREEYVDLYENAPVGYFTLSTTGVLLKANQTFYSLMRASAEELLGRNLTTQVLPVDQDKLYLLLRNLREGRGVGSVVVQMHLPSGDSFHSRWDVRSVQDPVAGEVVRVILSDVTKERLADDALEATSRLESLDALAGGIAHDFNNLLGGILGYIALARESKDASPRVIDYLEKAGSIFDRARSLTAQLMAFSQRNVPQTKVMDLWPLVEKSTAFILTGSETQFNLDGPDDLWPVRVDESLCGQLIDNLVLNASQAMGQRGSVQITLKNLRVAEGDIAALAAGDYVQMTVTDSGVGIPQALMRRVFDPFFTTKATGHGLGLATALSIVRKHGGALWGDSVEGQGSSFHVVLPAAPTEAAINPRPPVVDHRGAGVILIMDDEAFNLEILAEVLRTLGYDPVEARDGVEALSVSQGLPELKAAFLDLSVRGGQGGCDTVGPLVERFPGVPVFAMSGFCDNSVMAFPQNFGFTDRLEKPFRRREVAAMLAKHLGNYRTAPLVSGSTSPQTRGSPTRPG